MSKYTNIYELYAKVMENTDSINSRKAGIVNEDVKKDAVNAFDKVKPKQTLDIGYDSSISSNMSNKFVVKSKRKVKMGSSGMGEKITMQRIDPKSGNPSGGMKYFLYKRPDGNVSLALGDMGASMKSIKIEGYNEEKDLTLADECDTLDLDENFSPKEVKMAIGIASDPRYKQGNMTGAVKAIEKIKKNLSKHSQVAAVLKRQNEELLAYVKEGKMKNIATDVDDAMGNIAYKLETKGGRFVVKVDSNDEEDAQKAMKMHPLYIAGKLRVVPEGVEIDEGKAASRAQQAAIAISKKERGEKPKNEKVDPADIDDFATDDDVKQADNNILMQLRKTISLRGMKDVKFNDNKKVKVKEPIARAVFDRYSKLRTSIEKQKFQTQIAKSYKDLLNALKK
jgi:hypothetical protein